MRLPNGFGSVAKLSGNRRRPYIVKKTVGWKENGQPIISIIGYAATREEGLILLAQYNNAPWDVDLAKITLRGLYKSWLEKKAPKLGQSNLDSLRAAYKHCSALADHPYRQIKAYQMQETIDHCGRGYGTQGSIKNFWGHLDDYAMELDIITKRYSDLLTSAPAPPTTRKPFTDAEVDLLWEHRDDPWVDTVLIFLYSGWRISELLGLRPEDIDLTAGTMHGGVKTRAGKDRIVPIHSRIRPLIEARLNEGGPRLICHKGKPISSDRYRVYWARTMDRFGMTHVPHECRHTLESRLDSAGGNRRCIDLIMGHVSKDTGNRVYNHKTLAELAETIERIKN